MIIFSPQKLEQQLAKEELSTWEKVKYLVLAVVVSALAGPLFWITPTVKEQEIGFTALVQLVTTLIGLRITYTGIKHCYTTNNKGNQFIERFICLRVPWTVVFGLVLAPLSLIIILIAKKVFPQIPELASLIIYICSPLITFIYYRALNNSFTRIKVAQESSGPTAA